MIHSHRASTVVPRWDFYWKKAEQGRKTQKDQISILPVIIKSFGPPYLTAAFLTLILSILQVKSKLICILNLISM